MNPPKAFKIFVLAEPNIFTLPNNYTNLNSVKAEHVYSSFPLKFENAYLRFFYHDKPNNMKLWMDYPPNAVIPVYENKVYVKVLRLPKNIELRFKNDEYYSTKKSKENKPNQAEKENSKNSKSAKGSPNLIINDPPTISKNLNANQRQTHPAHGKSNEPRQADLRHEVKNENKSENNIHRVDLNSQYNNKTSRSTSNDKVGNNNNNRSPNLKGDNRNINIGSSNNFAYGGINLVPDDIDFSKISSNLKDTAELNDNKYKDIRNSKEPPSNNSAGSVFEAFNSFVFTGSSSSNNTKAEEKKNNHNNKPADKSNPFSVLGEIFTGQENFTMTNNKDSNTHSSSTNLNGFGMPSNNQPSSNHPIDQIPNNLDQETMEERVTQVINEWRMGLNEQKNLRYLLATFYEVWTHEPMWKEVTMQKLVEDTRSLKSYYKRAVGQTHPDKNTTRDAKTKFVANLLYNVLIEANVQLPM